MSLTDITTSRNVLLGASMMTGLVMSGVVMANRPEAQIVVESCGDIDPAVLAQIRPTHGPTDRLAGAGLERAMTLIMAAHRLCKNGDAKAARAVFRRADNELARHLSAGETEDR